MSKKPVDKALLKKLVPASALNGENFEELAAKAFQEEVAAGQVIFKQGDRDKTNAYVLDGEVELTDAQGGKRRVAAGSDEARHPLANHQPRNETAVAATACQIARLDGDLLDILLTWDQLSGIEVDEISDSDDEEEDDSADWMTRILQSKAFLQVPPANIQAMFMRMQEVPVRAGESVIRQGEEGDCYYIIKSGKCKVTRTSKTGSELTLAQLGDGDAFGEEALLSEAKRNANVVMTTDGTLMRLSKDDFNSLLKAPMLSWVSRQQAEEMVRQGAVMMDVRLESEYQNNGLENSLNIPLFMLRLKVDNLDPGKTYIAYCDTGRRSSAAAFLLSERGLQAYCLQGGLVESDSAG
ncbi:CRP-like cAMP-binding protein [Methylohalomonas lacus]|uniref:CRP-like cAMP-binding protein n=1 Tax=Methylohalomonas lacus TaxID=398773 RepID=A0AAE3L4R0_9GAMM|nr:cyclic nucleotide-binding domain-containing protein [Methylohalomonas lacus]MCS3904298.1 CRP-like cAMP-binding protein [Methylohalomonas lacus]